MSRIEEAMRAIEEQQAQERHMQYSGIYFGR